MTKWKLDRRTTIKGIAATGAFAASSLAAPPVLRAQDTVNIGFLTAMTGLETLLGEIQRKLFRVGR
jgi:urea transport system substrate-binding protein